MRQSKAPLFDALVEMADKRPASFHVPGHKSGQGIPSGAKPWYDLVMKLDMTEITGLDDLHQPEGIIEEAQRLAADCFGSEHTIFLVGGSTAGNLALIMALCNEGDLLIVQRDVHKSVLHGLMLAGARAVFMTPRIDEASGLSFGVDPEELDIALSQYPEAKGVLLTNPSYYGVSTNIGRIAEVVHSHGKPLMIDEAHGAHFGFHDRLPLSAIQCGADAAVQSAHKMLNALTMGAMLHIKGRRLNVDAVRSALAMLQSSSPSYPIMASLDLARRDMALHGMAHIERTLRILDVVREELKKLPWIGTVSLTTDDVALDPYKLPLYDRTGTLSGYELQHQLEERGCMVEMADPRYALLVFSPFSPAVDGVRLIDTIKQISDRFDLHKQEPAGKISNINMINTSASFSEPIRFHLPFRSSRTAIRLPLEQCAGTRCAEMIVPYPPGIPLLFPGETITPAALQTLHVLRQTGAKIQGAIDPSLQTISVYPS